jgi:hypothetical protein
MRTAELLQVIQREHHVAIVLAHPLRAHAAPRGLPAVRV